MPLEGSVKHSMVGDHQNNVMPYPNQYDNPLQSYERGILCGHLASRKPAAGITPVLPTRAKHTTFIAPFSSAELNNVNGPTKVEIIQHR